MPGRTTFLRSHASSSHHVVEQTGARSTCPDRSRPAPDIPTKLKPRSTLVATSSTAKAVMDYGAAVGWRLALNHPERVTSLIKRDLPDVELHLLDTRHFALEGKSDETIPF